MQQKRIAIMQPYLFPYPGYFKLIASANLFVIYDNVNYINRGWINRNYILLNGQKKLITYKIPNASQNKLIKDINIGSKNTKILETIRHAYNKSSQFKIVFPIIQQIIGNNQANLAIYISDQLKILCDYIGISTEFVFASELFKDEDQDLKGASKIIKICKSLNANHYINLPGGKDLYKESLFSDNDIKLEFLSYNGRSYVQKSEAWVPNLSIIDLIMNVKQADILDYIYNMLD